jgi:hypothetical protein|tara:strand:+ start:19548 stop:20417 length:870 start_codon:yes stop_codon:yes gene_type:complete
VLNTLVNEVEENMKISRQQLRKLIVEAAQQSYGLSDRFAIITNYQSSIFVKTDASSQDTAYNWGLFDVVKTINDIKTDPDLKSIAAAIINNTKSIISAWNPEKHFLNNGAYTVSRSAADDKFGPTLYDMVMSALPNGLTSDRSDVSKEAESLWDYYANKRSDVEKRFLDDMKAPITDDLSDDSYFSAAQRFEKVEPFEPTYSFNNKVTRDEFLNMSYNIKELSSEYTLLVDNFTIFSNMLNSIPPETNKAMSSYHKFKEDNLTLAYHGMQMPGEDPTNAIVGRFFMDRY